MKAIKKTITYKGGVIERISEVNIVDLSKQKDKLLSEIEALEMEARKLYRDYKPLIDKFKGIRSHIADKWNRIEEIRQKVNK